MNMSIVWVVITEWLIIRMCGTQPLHRNQEERVRSVLGTVQSGVTISHLCNIYYGESDVLLVSACSIYTLTYLFTSVDNLSRHYRGGYGNQIFYEDIEHLFVLCGATEVIISRDQSQNTNLWQARNITQLYIPRNDNYLYGDDIEIVTNISGSLDTLVLLENGMAKEPIALVQLLSPLKLTPTVGPLKRLGISIVDIYQSQITEWINSLEQQNQTRITCRVGSWGLTGQRKLVLQRVAYVKKDNCQETYCAYNEANCLRYPYQDYHMCFKSLMYGDVCTLDQGAALFCNWAWGTTIGILTGTVDCGLQGLPAVYTMISVGMDLSSHIEKPKTAR